LAILIYFFIQLFSYCSAFEAKDLQLSVDQTCCKEEPNFNATVSEKPRTGKSRSGRNKSSRRSPPYPPQQPQQQQQQQARLQLQVATPPQQEYVVDYSERNSPPVISSEYAAIASLQKYATTVEPTSGGQQKLHPLASSHEYPEASTSSPTIPAVDSRYFYPSYGCQQGGGGVSYCEQSPPVIGVYSYPAVAAAEAYRRYYDNVNSQYLAAAAAGGFYDHKLYRHELAPSCGTTSNKSDIMAAPQLTDCDSCSPLEVASAAVKSRSPCREDITCALLAEKVNIAAAAMSLKAYSGGSESCARAKRSSDIDGKSPTSSSGSHAAGAQFYGRSPHDDYYGNDRTPTIVATNTAVLVNKLTPTTTAASSCGVNEKRRKTSVPASDYESSTSGVKGLLQCSRGARPTTEYMTYERATDMPNNAHPLDTASMTGRTLKEVDDTVGGACSRQTVISDNYGIQPQSSVIMRRRFAEDSHPSVAVSTAAASDISADIVSEKYSSSLKHNNLYNNTNSTYRMRETNSTIADSSLYYQQQYEAAYRQHQYYGESVSSSMAGQRLLPPAGYTSVIVDAQQFNMANGYVH